MKPSTATLVLLMGACSAVPAPFAPISEPEVGPIEDAQSWKRDTGRPIEDAQTWKRDTGRPIEDAQTWKRDTGRPIEDAQTWK
ncbi:hypothetical protein NQ176_g2726 [Zarea fungicola]|uniref:Uncharacterized protein n=1 Tax=Zarea fungicola TaxID=93591 RepID=A0ACC1NNY5_9HYPO|nr:hypothetical protein NQ176_g2726 [Lecanicillium fungicola]